jgi:uncharacterized protein (DUF1800 family)
MSISPGPWEPFQPSAADPWDLRKVAHLHRRAGFGATRAELLRDQTAGPAASVDRLLHPRARTTEEKDTLAILRQGMLKSGDMELLKAWWLYRILYDPDPLREKLTLFWHGHFATSNAKVGSLPRMLRQNETIRRHAMGAFADMLQEVIADPAMLVWLDSIESKKEKPNENFAREFLELFTLGIGHYTEKDIREAARAFTGWAEIPNDKTDPTPGFRQDSAKFDAGTKTFLKQAGAWKPADIVRITLEQPAAAVHLCRKLYRFFVSESAEPRAELIRPLAAELRNHQFSIRHVVEIIFRSRHFYSKAAYRQRLKSPVEFTAGLVRSLEVPRTEPNLLLPMALTCERQGQELFYPATVKGWDGGKSWFNSSTLLERDSWGNDLIWGNADFGLAAYDPLGWAKGQNLGAPETTPALIDLLLQGDLDAQDRQLIERTASDGRADSIRKALQLILHCPQYQLA